MRLCQLYVWSLLIPPIEGPPLSLFMLDWTEVSG